MKNKVAGGQELARAGVGVASADSLVPLAINPLFLGLYWSGLV